MIQDKCVGNNVRYALTVLPDDLLVSGQDDDLTIEFLEELAQYLSSMLLIDTRKRCIDDVRHIDFIELRECLVQCHDKDLLFSGGKLLLYLNRQFEFRFTGNELLLQNFVGLFER